MKRVPLGLLRREDGGCPTGRNLFPLGEPGRVDVREVVAVDEVVPDAERTVQVPRELVLVPHLSPLRPEHVDEAYVSVVAPLRLPSVCVPCHKPPGFHFRLSYRAHGVEGWGPAQEGEGRGGRGSLGHGGLLPRCDEPD